MEPQDYSKYHYKIIENHHIRKIFDLNIDQATYKLKKVLEKCNKTKNDDLWLIELCQHTKVEIDKVVKILGLSDKGNNNHG